MAVFTVSDDIINSMQAQDYLTRADRRVLIGVRATLEMLGIPVPEFAKRKPPGRPPARAVAAAFSADNPKDHTPVVNTGAARTLTKGHVIGPAE